MTQREVTDKDYKSGRILYIIEAALEYFIALGIGGAYLAKLGLEIGMSQSLIAIVEAFVSLGSGFQIFTVLLTSKAPVKPWVTALHIISQILFSVIWFIPHLGISKTVKTALLVFMVLSAQIMHNIINSPKTSWFMSLVDDRKRGIFTAHKEIVSLIGGMFFSLVYGKMIDYFEQDGNILTAFVLCGCLLLLCSVGHTLTLVFTKEPAPIAPRRQIGIKKELKSLFCNKRLMLVMVIPVVWNIIHYSTLPFYAVYQNTDLGFSPFYISVVAVGYSIARAIASSPMGKLADKRSFAFVMNICFCIAALSYFINIFTTPANGHVMYLIAYMLFGVSMAGINSGIMNIIYDMVDHSHRTPALALKSSVAGVIGFLTTLACTPLVSFIQGAGNKFLGISVYAPQVMSAIALVLVLLLLLYNTLVVSKLKRVSDEKSDN